MYTQFNHDCYHVLMTGCVCEIVGMCDNVLDMIYIEHYVVSDIVLNYETTIVAHKTHILIMKHMLH